MGDVDNDDTVTVVDATRIQRVLASIDQKGEFYDVVGDVDQDKNVTIVDATVIQRFLASLPNKNALINVRVGGGSGQPVVNPTQPVVTPTEAYDDPDSFPTEDGFYTLIFTNSEGWEGSINLYYWDEGGSPLEWPGEPMDYYDSNEYGQSRYIGFVPTECEHFLVDCGDGSIQSVDCDVLGHIGVYLDHFDEESGKWAIGTWDL
jgi:hypothetical protein